MVIASFGFFELASPNVVVIIEGEDEMVTLFTSSSYSVAREQAETISAFVHLNCHDEVQEC